ncbi:MAG: TIM barrel protein [Spirochaetaceae bacterium]|nr:TIM barrel protein [Spirochaetaceae bacterium]
MADVAFSVFTKHWRSVPLGRLGDLVRSMGFEGVELPVRPGFQVEPERAHRALPAAARQLADAGVTIRSVAATVDEAMIMACADTGVPVIRIMAPIRTDESYAAAEQRYRREFDALLPVLDRAGVTLGVQNHAGRQVANAIGLRSLIGRYDPRLVAAIWDARHEAVAGTEPELAIDVIWPHLCVVNLKNAVWLQTAETGAASAEWSPYWTAGRLGLSPWPRVATELRRRGYAGTVCLAAEYSGAVAVERQAAEDLAFARTLLA